MEEIWIEMKVTCLFFIFMVAINFLKVLPVLFNAVSTKYGLDNGCFMNTALP